MGVNEDKLLHKDEVFVILNFKNTKAGMGEGRFIDSCLFVFIRG